MNRFVTIGRSDGSIEIRPDDQDHGLSIHPSGERLAVYAGQEKWFECDTLSDCFAELETLLTTD